MYQLEVTLFIIEIKSFVYIHVRNKILLKTYFKILVTFFGWIHKLRGCEMVFTKQHIFGANLLAGRSTAWWWHQAFWGDEFPLQILDPFLAATS